jgi:hypothetical protein
VLSRSNPEIPVIDDTGSWYPALGLVQRNPAVRLERENAAATVISGRIE